MGHKHKKITQRIPYKERMKQKRKESKQHVREKKARLIVKNLPFKITEDDLRKHFEQYGTVKEVQLLRRPDGKLKGCGFVQFEAVQKAAKARHHTNGKPLLGREIQVDFAVAKDRYLQKIKAKEVKQETEDKPDLSAVKVEDVIEIKHEDVDDVGDEVKDLTEGGDVKDEGSDEDDSESDDESVTVNDEQEAKKPRVISNDVAEGKTVFVKNLPFEATNDDLRECMCQFGPVFYALICVDKLTEHSKGTGFVKFRNKEDADKCLEAGTELKLLDNILDCHPALNKNDVQRKSSEKREKTTDSRNLYLVKEGVVLAGSKAAEGVSATDMAKRLQLEQYKTQMLRNLNMFVSKNRLIVHNLPPTWDDAKLRALFKKHSGPKAIIREAKIMRNLRQVDNTGTGESKEHGFVTFTTHEHALNALRSLNNNPDVFSPAKRPIVAFSIENRVMVKAKEKRMEQSRKQNPLSKDYDPKIKEAKAVAAAADKAVAESNEFSGVAATPGVKKMRSKFNLKTQAKMHHEYLKNEKKKKKKAKQTLEAKKKNVRQAKGKGKKDKNESDSFSKMVSDYKQKIMGAVHKTSEAKKAKWYE